MTKNQFLVLLKVATRIDGVWVKPRNYGRTFKSLSRKYFLEVTHQASYIPHVILRSGTGRVPARVKASITIEGLKWLKENYMNRSIAKREEVLNQIIEKLEALEVSQ